MQLVAQDLIFPRSHCRNCAHLGRKAVHPILQGRQWSTTLELQVQGNSDHCTQDSWSDYNIDAKRYFFYTLNSEVEEARFCHNNWKASQLITNLHTSWHTTTFPGAHKTKRACERNTAASSSALEPEDDSGRSKRCKTEDIKPMMEVDMDSTEVCTLRSLSLALTNIYRWQCLLQLARRPLRLTRLQSVQLLIS